MRSSHVMIRLTEAEAADLGRAASASLLAVSTWARVTLLTVARRGGKTGKPTKDAQPRVRAGKARKPRPKTPPASGADQQVDPMPARGETGSAPPEAAMPRCSRHKRVGCTKDPKCVRETTVFRP
ncbi:MAG: hypothetical protein Q8R28_07530 [Dehalococcoidia bacterium]|nr:hypothetical protein [Dehalococcoidia bacterium]